MVNVVGSYPKIYFSPNKNLSFGVSDNTEKKKEDLSISKTVLTLGLLGGAIGVGLFSHRIYKLNKALAEKNKKSVDMAEQIKPPLASQNSHGDSQPNGLFNIEIKDFEQTKLYEKYKNSKKQIFEFVKDANEKPEEIKEFLFGVTSHSEKSREFIKEITQNPRKSKEITKTLVEKIGGKENFVDWYFKEKGYQNAYAKHVDNVFNQAKKPEELLKVSPNWQYYKLEEKFKNDFTIGELPTGIKNIETYRTIVQQALHNKDFPEGINKIKNLEQGLSGKGACLIELDNKKYVLKYHYDYTEYSQGLKDAKDKEPWLNDTFFKKVQEDVSMKSDSAFINAQTDYYLGQNNCQNNANIYFFDAKTNSSLYEFVEGDSYKPKELDILTINKELKSFNDLGITYNDVQPNNFKVANGTIKCIDSGESTYSDILKPGVSHYHFKSPNLNGLDLQTCLAGLNDIN